MLNTSNARIRLVLSLICLTVVFVLSLVIMGTVGVFGHITFENLDSGCLLYMSIDNEVPSYNNGYCLFPIIGGAITCITSLLFMAYWSMILHRRDDFAPRFVSMAMLATCVVMALFSFAICGEIGIGLNKACGALAPGQKLAQCRSTRNFAGLYAAQVCAGLMGGFWLGALIVEWFQFKKRPSVLSTSSDPVSQTAVLPHHR
ncbi:hypothetical protein BG015_004245 [Linnemannia schmuckeri]|uniref:Uncharacterized protein n=1 Tax=Linnemannia schmuckeri TaxID=64567 RepID=A0A9P5VD48_9FUNG|nr:hypothetical protein BG015_004245 [Linnemannia schmuckeri]